MATRRTPISSTERAEMLALRAAGASYREIAGKLGRTYNGVRLALDERAREKSRQCTASRRKRLLAADPDAYYEHERQTSRAFHSRRPELKMLYSAKESAKSQGIPFDLEEADIVIPEVCPVLGLRIEKSGGSRTYNSPSLDRLVPSLGYVKGNVQVISWRANKLKGEGTAAEHMLIAQWMLSQGAE